MNLSEGRKELSTLEGEHVIRQVVELFVIEGKFWHEGTGGNGLRVFEVSNMPLTVWSAIGDKREVWAHIHTFPMNAMTGVTIELFH